MKKNTLLFVLVSLLANGLWAQNQKSNLDSVSYNLGILIAQSLKSQGFGEVNLTEFAKGVTDAFSGVGVDLNKCNESVNEFMREKQAKRMQEMAALAPKNLAEGKKFLEENKKRPGVVTTASGLQYEVLKAGAGAKPKASDQVTVHYEGKLLNDFIFDSSIKRGEPATFPLTRVISGWTEGLQLMPLGSKFKFYIPSQLAYGEQGRGEEIGPNATLVFEIELFKIN